MKLGIIALAIAACGGTSTPAEKRASDAVTVVRYERELDRCRAEGKAANSYAVYETCANEVDHRLCATRGLRCADGGAP